MEKNVKKKNNIKNSKKYEVDMPTLFVFLFHILQYSCYLDKKYILNSLQYYFW